MIFIYWFALLQIEHPNKKDTFHDILEANDKNTLLDYLIERPLVIEYEGLLNGSRWRSTKLVSIRCHQ